MWGLVERRISSIDKISGCQETLPERREAPKRKKSANRIKKMMVFALSHTILFKCKDKIARGSLMREEVAKSRMKDIGLKLILKSFNSRRKLGINHEKIKYVIQLMLIFH